MNNKRSKLVLSIASFLLVIILLIGYTFEGKREGFSVRSESYFTSGETNFDIQLFWSNNPDNDGWTAADESGSNMAFSSTVLWEPGHTEIRYFRIANAGNVDFTYEFDLDSPGDEYDSSTDDIGDVVDVYLTTDISDISTAVFTKKGTLNEVILNPNVMTDKLAAGSSAFCALKFVMSESAGNDYQGHRVGFRIKADAYAEESEPEFSGTFGCVFPDYDTMLYRVGNSNPVPASSLFYINEEESTSTSSLMMRAYAAESLDSSLVTFSSSNVAGKAAVTITPDTTAWAKTSFSFSDTGVVNIKLLYNKVEKVSLNLEVMAGKNVTSATSATGSDIILLNDVSTTGNLSVSGGHTLYGNGFSITDKRSTTSGTAGFMNINNGSLDNVRVIGQEYPKAITSGTSNNYYSPCVNVNTKGYIYNCNISGCRYAILNATGNLYIENSLVSGGTLANISINSGNVTIKDSITSRSINADATCNGAGIVIQDVNSKIIIEGTFAQYNWLTKSELPTTIQTILSSVYNDSTYAYTTGGKTYVHAGIVCLSEVASFTEETASAAIPNKPENYSSTLKTASSVTAVLYAEAAAYGTAEKVAGLSSYTSAGQYPTLPGVSFDYTTLNYIEKTTDSNKYCYYDSNTGVVNISYETANDSSFDWNPMILTANKYGSDISYTVSMNGTDYTNKTISFTETGNYTVTYSYTDLNWYYGKNATRSSIGYTGTVSISVTAVEPDIVAYHPLFTYTTGASKSVVASNNTYIMPAVTGTGDSIGSTTVGGQTIYYPMVTVNGANSSGDAYSKGGLYYFAPAFSEINITDYNQSTGDTQYTYNTSCQTWPHGKTSTAGPDTSVYNYDKSPYEPSSGSSSQGYKYLSGTGLCYSTSNLERDGVNGNKLIRFFYVGNDGTTYYYYICYVYTATTYSASTCFASGTTVTTSSGEKPIEELELKDKIISWNFCEGESEEKEICLLVDHGKEICDVINLEFSDGTVLRIITQHGLYDYDLNDFVYIDKRNCKDYIGHRFVKYKSNGRYKKVKLTGAYVTTEETHAYSIATADNLNAFTNGMLTLTPPGDYYNPVRKGKKLKFDMEELNKDIEKYGLYEYEDFKDYLTLYQFCAFNVDYMKVPVSKGEITFDYILQLIEGYSEYFA